MIPQALALLLLVLCSDRASATAENGLPNLGATFVALGRDVGQLAGALVMIYEVRNMTTEEVWCTFDEERKEFCGGTFEKPYSACIAMYNVTWPDSFGPLGDPATIGPLFLYLNFTADLGPTSTIWPGLPALCLCEPQNASDPLDPDNFHAYYIPNEVYPIPRFQPECHAEAGLLFCYVLLAVLYLIILYWALMELIMWVLMFVVKEKQCNILGGFLPKVFCVITIILLLANIGMINGSGQSTAQWKFAVYWTWIWAGMSIVSAYLWWLVVFADVVIKTTKLSKETSMFIQISKWLVVIFVCLILVGFLVSMGIAYNFALRLTEATYFPDKLDLFPHYVHGRQANIVIGCIMIFCIILWGMALTGYSTYLIFKNKNSELRRKMGEKTFWNTVALVFWWPVLFTLVVIGYYVSWHEIEISEYETQMAFMWVYMIENACIWVILLAITIALRTHFAEDSGYCASICGNLKTIEQETMSRGSSGTRTKGISGGSSSHSATVN